MTYNQNAIELEAFSRPLWALVPFWVGGGSEPEFETIYRKGLAAGATRKTPNTGHHRGIRPVLCGDGCHCLRHPHRTGKVVDPAF